jgi:hypothetical protein
MQGITVGISFLLGLVREEADPAIAGTTLHIFL